MWLIPVYPTLGQWKPLPAGALESSQSARPVNYPPCSTNSEIVKVRTLIYGLTHLADFSLAPTVAHDTVWVLWACPFSITGRAYGPVGKASVR